MGCSAQAIIGMFFQDGLTGSAWGDWSLYTSSPLRARDESKVARNFFGGETTSYASFDPAKELGVQDPIGFWDPLGLSADKDEATFKRRRAVEIKHGRIVQSSDLYAGSSHVCELIVLWNSFPKGRKRECQDCLRPCMRPSATLFQSTTSSQDTFLLLSD